MSEEKPMVLVVDDDPVMRCMHLKLLSDFNARTLEATNTIEAESMMRAHKPTLVLLDDIMPDCPSGLSMLERIKKDEEIADIPVIMVTASNKNEEKARGIHAGAAAYITKPVDQDALRAAIKAVLMQRRKSILMIMDDKVLAEALKNRLVHLKCDVHYGESVFVPETANSKDPDLVIVSYAEGQTGRWWHDQLRGMAGRETVPILIIGFDEAEGEGLSGPAALVMSDDVQDILVHAGRLLNSKRR